MKILRRKYVQKILSIFFLIIFLENTFLSTTLLALTTGPNMPEYTSYGAAEASDLVDLNSGDFSFSLPILDVPSPEGGFSVPLTYNAGIGLEQEASWTGLGWNVNVGAITRSVQGYPDDANGEAQSVTVQDLTGVYGYSLRIPGIMSFGWDNVQGQNGQYNLLSIFSGSWGKGGKRSHSVLGIRYNGSAGKGFDAMEFGSGVISIASIAGGGYMAATKAASEKGAEIAAGELASESFNQAASSLAVGGALSELSKGVASESSTTGYWKYSKTKISRGLGTLYHYWLDQTRYESMYGTMYLGNAPTSTYSNPGSPNAQLSVQVNGASKPLECFIKPGDMLNRGSASDINYQPDPDPNVQFYRANNPALLATDNFIVRAPQIAGQIEPYRLEVGSVSMPRPMTDYHQRFAFVKYLANDASYKVPFVYKGQPSNNYYYHVGGALGVTAPTFYYGITKTVNTGSSPNTIQYNLTDVAFGTQRIRSDISSSKKIPQADYIEWLSNDEIKASVTYPSKFMDFLPGGPSSPRSLFRTSLSNINLRSQTYTTSFDNTNIPVDPSIVPYLTNAKVDIYVSSYADIQNAQSGNTQQYVALSAKDVFSVNTTANSIRVNDAALTAINGKPANVDITIVAQAPNANGFGSTTSLGGFCITSANGTTYHFALPVYDYGLYSEVRQISDNTKKSIIRRDQSFANTWLLTAITGPDFLDRNANGMVDDGDWGAWIKFNYGHQTNLYTWRVPYAANTYTAEPDTYESYATGKKQLIYLNSIETRSHVALFLKGQRTDAKSAGPEQINPYRLEEIALVTKEDYKKLYTSFSVPNYSNDISNLCLSSQFASGGAARTYLNANCEKRIMFNYDYSLCNGVPNSTSGKLTLKSISMLGRDDKRVLPDFKFEYAGANPSYDANKWDAYGYYSRDGSSVGTSHKVSQATADADGAAWSLTKITNPLGSELTINYERDSYSNILGSKIPETSVAFSNSGTMFYPTAFPIKTLSINHNGAFKVGDYVKFTAGNVTFSCPQSSGTKNYPSNYLLVTAVTAGSVTFDQPFLDFSECTPLVNGDHVTCSSFTGTLTKYNNGVKGDGLRVASLVFQDEFDETPRKVRYLYNEVSAMSSGGISQEPDYVSSNANTIPGLPMTPVIYGKVSVLTGKFIDDNDYASKEVYEFETPNSTHYTLNKNVIENMNYFNSFTATSMYENKIEDRTSKIGSLLSVKVYDKNDVLFSSKTLSYGEQMLNNGTDNHQGVYSRGTLMFDKVAIAIAVPIPVVYKATRTTSIQYPNVLTGVVTTTDGFVNTSQNLNWDFLTGQVVESTAKSSLGISIKTVTKPAYTIYPELGPKTMNINNRNMLQQSAGVYTYRVNDQGATMGLTAASIQTWTKDWPNYRYFNGSSFVDATKTDYPVWRKGAQYNWRGNYTRLQADGSHSFAPADEFNYATPDLTLWAFSAEYTKFNYYGYPLETRNSANFFSAVKMGYDERVVIASAANARSNEVAFTSAEDEIIGSGYFSNEIAIKSTGGDGIVVKDFTGATVHSGYSALSLSTGYGFVTKPTGLIPSKTYRACVWSNSPNGRIYYKLNGGAEMISGAPTVQGKAGWYKIDIPITIGSTFTSLEVGVKSSSGTVVFDDFRFQPADAVMTCYVQPPPDFQYTAGAPSYSFTLDDMNQYIKTEMSNDGLTNRVYAESKDGEKLVSEIKRDYKKFH